MVDDDAPECGVFRSGVRHKNTRFQEYGGFCRSSRPLAGSGDQSGDIRRCKKYHTSNAVSKILRQRRHAKPCMNMRRRVVLGVLAGLLRLGTGHRHDEHLRRLSMEQIPLAELSQSQKQINQDIRQYWMRQANEALSSPCPFAPFGTVIVNHTVDGRGNIVCTGENTSHQSGNPMMHGKRLINGSCSVTQAAEASCRVSIGELTNNR